MSWSRIGLLPATLALLAAVSFAANNPPAAYTGIAAFSPVQGSSAQQSSGSYAGLWLVGPGGGTYAGDAWTGSANSWSHRAAPLVVTIAPGSGNTDANCVYTLDGSIPSANHGTSCSQQITIYPTANGYANKMTVKAIDFAFGSLTDSAVESWIFTVETTVQPSAFSILTSTGVADVSLSDTWTGVTSSGSSVAPLVHYELFDSGSPPVTPTASVGTSYRPNSGAAIAVASNSSEQTLEAVSYAAGYVTSPVATELYGTGYAANSNGTRFFVGAGASAQLYEYALAMGGIVGNGVEADGSRSPCGSHHFTAKGGGHAVDLRSTLTPPDTGDLAIVWDNSDDTTDANIYRQPYTSGEASSAAYPSPAPPQTICVYLSVNSAVAVKAFMNSNLSVPGEQFQFLTHSGPANLIAPFWAASGTAADESEIPADVAAAVSGQAFNAAITDIRPEDAYFATTRALGALTTARTGLGYGAGAISTPIGTPVSSIAGTSSNTVIFAITGRDPISGATQASFTTMPVGAAPVLVLVNKYGGAAGDGQFHFGNSAVANIGRFTLAGYLNGSITATDALSPANPSSVGYVTPLPAPVSVWLLDPLSGTHNTMEWNVTASKEIASSQEIGVVPSVATACTSSGATIAPGSSSAFFRGFSGISGVTCTGMDSNGNSGNPLWIQVNPAATSTDGLGTVGSTNLMIGINGATRARAIGSGEMVKQVALVTHCTFKGETNGAVSLASGSAPCQGSDALGYAFWSFGNMSYANNYAPFTTKYLMVDGVDPLRSAYSGGELPVCDATNYIPRTGCPQPVGMPNVVNGSYPLWAIYRAIADPNLLQSNPLINAVIAEAKNNALVVSDFVPMSSMLVFRSHYLQAGVVACNGHLVSLACPNEKGGDMGGAVYPIQEDYNHIAEYGAELTAARD